MLDGMALNGDVQYNPAVLIGLGGSGILAARYALLAGYAPAIDQDPLDRGLAKALSSKYIVPVGIDTDFKPFNPIPVNPLAFPRAMMRSIAAGRVPAQLPQIDSQLLLSREDIDRNLDQLRKYARRSSQNAAQTALFDSDDENLAWLAKVFAVDLELIEQVAPRTNHAKTGAGQMRALGRLALLGGLGSCRELLHSSYHTAATEGASQPTVVIFSSIAGGTGAGMFLDVAFLLRRFVEPKARIVAHLLLPDVFTGRRNTENVMPNAYASLIELSTLAQPRGLKPLDIEYRIDGEDKKPYEIRPNGEPVFDEVYLYDSSASRLDWSPEGAPRSQATIDAACRMMSDTALGFLRRDYDSAVSGKENEDQRLVNQALQERRIFHSAASVAIRPLDPVEMAGILSKAVAAQCLWPAMNARRSAPADLSHKKVRDSALKLLDRRMDILSDPEDFKGNATRIYDLDEVKKARELYENKNWLKDTKQSFLWRNRDFPNQMVERIEERLNAVGLYSLLDAMWDGDPLLHSGDDAKVTTTELDVSDFFGKRLDAILHPIENYVKLLEGNAHLPSHQLYTQIENLENALNDQAHYSTPMRVNVSLSDDLRRNRSLIRLVLEKTDNKDFSEIEAHLARWNGAKNPELELRRLFTILFEDVARAFKHDGKEQIFRRSALSGEFFDARLANWKVRVREMKASVAEAIGQSKLMVETLNRTIGRVEIGSDDWKKQCEPIVASLAPLQDFLHDIAWDRSDLAHGLDTLEIDRRKNRRRYAEACLREELEYVQPNLPSSLASPLPQAFSDRAELFYAELIDEVVGLRVSHADLVERLLPRAISSAFLKCESWVDEKAITPSQFAENLDKLEKVCHDVLGALTSFSEFAVSRLGGPNFLKSAAAYLNFTPYTRATSAGAFNPSYAVLVPPKMGGNMHASTDEEQETNTEISKIFAKELQTKAETARISSNMPFLQVERRYFGAHQIGKIEEYSSAYSAVTQNERALFHTIKEALNFTPILSEIETQEKAEFWDCMAHGKPHRNPYEALHCAECRRDYLAGRRRLSEIRLRPASNTMRPIPDRFGGLRFDIHVPENMIQYFDDGIPEWRRYDETEMSLVASAFPEEAVPGTGWDQSDPPHLLIPAVPSDDKMTLERVERSQAFENRFRQASRNRPLFECGHCNFPISDDLSVTEGLNSVICPRCRRNLNYCPSCASKEYCYVAANIIGAGGGEAACARCEGSLEI